MPNMRVGFGLVLIWISIVLDAAGGVWHEALRYSETSGAKVSPGKCPVSLGTQWYINIIYVMLLLLD